VGPGPRARGWSAAFGGDEEAHYRRRWHALHAAVHLLRTRRPMPKEHDSWARAPAPEAGSPWRTSGEIFCGVSRHQWGNLSLKRDSPSVVAILIARNALSPSSSPCSSAAVAAMALLDPPERLQPEVALN
jgi:hypothetical protein